MLVSCETAQTQEPRPMTEMTKAERADIQRLIRKDLDDE